MRDRFHRDVLPIGVFLCAIRCMLIVMSFTLPDGKVIFVERISVQLNRLFGSCCGVVPLMIGVGLSYRRRWGWIAFITCVCGGLFVEGAYFLFLGFREMDLAGLMIGFQALLVSFGLYHVTAKYFRGAEKSVDQT